MFFTNIARLLAWLGLAFGTMRIALGVLLANGLLGSAKEYLSLYTKFGTTGEMIDAGLFTVGAAVIVGMIAEASRAMHRI